MVAFDEFRKDEKAVASMAKVKRLVTEGKGEKRQPSGNCEDVWGMLHADDADCVSQLRGSLEK